MSKKFHCWNCGYIFKSKSELSIDVLKIPCRNCGKTGLFKYTREEYDRENKIQQQANQAIKIEKEVELNDTIKDIQQ